MKFAKLIAGVALTVAGPTVWANSTVGYQWNDGLSIPSTYVSEGLTDWHNRWSVPQYAFGVFPLGEPDENGYSELGARFELRPSAFGRHLALGFTEAQDELHKDINLSFGATRLALQHGNVEGPTRLQHGLTGMRSNFFHGRIDQRFDYVGGTLMHSFADYGLSALAGAVRLSSSGFDDREAFYIGANGRSLSALIGSVSRSGDDVGRFFDLTWRAGPIRVGYANYSTQLDAEIHRFSLERDTAHGTFRFALDSGRNPLYRDADETRVMFSFRLPIGNKVFRATEDEESDADAVDNTNRNIAIGVGMVAAVAALSGGGSDSDKRFSTQLDAAFDRLQEVNPRSVRENREYGGSIYRHGDGTYSSTKPIKGTNDSVAFNPITIVPRGTTATAYYHTHAAYDPRYASEVFSRQDIRFLRFWRLDGYLATPAGRMWWYELRTGTEWFWPPGTLPN